MNEQEILKRMQEHVQRSSPPGTLPKIPVANTGPIQSDASELRRAWASLQTVRSTSSAFGQINPRHPGIHNQLLQVVKKFVRRMLTWYTRSLQEFHAAVAQQEEEQLRILEVLSAHQKQLEQTCKRLQKAQARLDNEQVRICDEQTRVAKLLIASSGSTQQSHVHYAGFDYTRFQSQFRGTEQEIKGRQREYAHVFQGANVVVDLGCGRGEFLEVMRENGIAASGVESSSEAVETCVAKGLDVTKQDLFEFLEAAKPVSIGGIFCAQVIEHLPINLQLYLVDLCYAKLKPGAPLVVETVNPECAFALMRNFYLDPTHVRPVPPELLKFAMETKGFTPVELKFSGPVQGRYRDDLRSAGGAELQLLIDAAVDANRTLFGPQDYAAIGWKNKQ